MKKRNCFIRWFSVICMFVLLLLGLYVTSVYAEKDDGTLILRLGTLETASIQTRQIRVKCNQFISLGIDGCEADCSYQWQYLPSDGKEWQNWAGRTSNSLYEMAYDQMDGWMIRCGVTQKGKTEWTEMTSIEVLPTILDARIYRNETESYSIRESSGLIKNEEGTSLTIRLTCSRDDLSYQWYISNDQENWTALDGEKDEKLSLTLTTNMNDTYLNCIVQDGCGRSDSLWEACKYPINCLHIVVMPGKTDSEETIYVLNPYYENEITIPDNLPGKIDLKGQKCIQVEGESAKEEDGTIVPVKQTFRVVDTDEVYEEYVLGDTVFVLENGKSIRVHVMNYAKIFAQGVMDQYMAEKITTEMTERQKAETCCEFVCNYEYSANHSGYIGMII